jgi:galactokinase
MNSAALSAALVARGLDPSERPAKQALFEQTLDRFSQLPPPRPSEARGNDERVNEVYAWWVPGRLEVFGTHTDYAGGRTLVCAVPRGFAVVARRRNDGTLHVVDARREQDVIVTSEDVDRFLQSSSTGWRRYVAVVLRRLARNFPAASLGADVVFASDLPRASGMSSSSALMVAVAKMLVKAGNLDARAEWRENIATAGDEAGYYACIENGLSFGTLSGDGGVGTQGGSEDHAAILTAAPGNLSAFAFVPMRSLEIVPLAAGWTFVVTPSGVPAQKAGTAREAYNRLAEGTRTLLDIWNERSGSACSSLAAALMPGEISLQSIASPPAVEQLRGWIRASRVPGWDPPALGRRLDHFIREDARIAEAVVAFAGADAVRLGQLAADSQSEAESLLGNQIPETKDLARTARAVGAFASRSFGAGFGGSVWALIERSRAAEFAAQWMAEAFIARPGPPLVELTSSGF